MIPAGVKKILHDVENTDNDRKVCAHPSGNEIASSSHRLQASKQPLSSTGLKETGAMRGMLGKSRM
jgi:hypothetical protein